MKSAVLQGYGLFLLGLLSLSACRTEQSTICQLPPLVQPPVPEFDPTFTTFELENEQSYTYTHSSGTTIQFPANAFLTSDSQVVKGIVQCRYREFQNAADIFLAGIPMQYKTGHLETAGSFELQASQNGQPLLLSQDQTVQVRLASHTVGDDYDFFYLDENQRGWDKLGTAAPEVNPEVKKLKRKISRMQPSLPFPLNKRYMGFSYQALLDVFYGNSVPKDADEAAAKKRFDAYGLAWTDILNWQNINWKGRSIPAAFMVWKTIKRKAFPSWTEGYQAKLTNIKGNRYQLDIISKDSSQHFQTELAAVMPLKDLFAFSPEEWRNNYKATMLKIQQEEERLAMMAAVYREFNISQLGIYNWDRLIKMEESIQLEANFQFPQQFNEKLTEPEIVYIAGDNRSVIKFPQSVWASMSLLPEDKGRFFCLLPDRQLVVYPKAKFAQIDFEAVRQMEQPGYVFGMEDGGKVATPKELKRKLDLWGGKNL